MHSDRELEHLRILIDDLVRAGKSEREIVAAVRSAERDGGAVLHGRRRSFRR